VGLAFAFSLVFGIGFALLIELSNNTVRTIKDVEKKIRLPVVALVPTVKGGTVRRLLPNAGVLQLRNEKRNQRPLLLYEEPGSPLTEVYRKLRTLVLLSTPKQAPKSVLVTSGMPSEGKTTTAVNLALVLAQTGATVLLVDADMRQPLLHEIFDLDNSSGLSSLLAKEASEADILARVEQFGDSELYILPAGPIPDNPSELLASEQMRRVMDALSGTFTHIVIDSPPVITCTDSVLVASVVDSVLLVVRGGKSTHEIVNHTRRELQEVGANIFGVVLNNVDVTPQDNYYYYARPA
jgi:capsular exopolysaccharide synthesis family protein